MDGIADPLVRRKYRAHGGSLWLVVGKSRITRKHRTIEAISIFDFSNTPCNQPNAARTHVPGQARTLSDFR